VPGAGCPEPRQHLREFRLAVACHADDAENLATTNVKGDGLESFLTGIGVDRQVSYGEPDGALRPGGFAPTSLDVATDHQGREGASGRLSSRLVRHHAATAQHGDAVGDREDLVEFVADQDDALAIVFHAFDHREEAVDLLRREHARGFIEDQKFRALQERFEDFDPLLFSGAEVCDAGMQVNLEAVAARELLDGACEGAGGEDGGEARKADREVLGDRVALGEVEVLRDEADACGACVAWGAKANALAAQVQGTLVGRLESVEHVHERGLPRSILAEKGTNLAAGNGEVDRVVGHHAGEALGDASHFEKSGMGGRCGGVQHRGSVRRSGHACNRRTRRLCQAECTAYASAVLRGYVMAASSVNAAWWVRAADRATVG